MSRIWNEIDLHIVLMLALFPPSIFLGWWWLALPLLMPQGHIYVRAAWDLPKSGRQSLPYVAANELLVLLTVGLFSGVRLFICGMTGDA